MTSPGMQCETGTPLHSLLIAFYRFHGCLHIPENKSLSRTRYAFPTRPAAPDVEQPPSSRKYTPTILLLTAALLPAQIS